MGEVTVGWRLSKEWARCDDGTATVARMGKVAVGRRLSQEWARFDDGTAAVAIMGEVTVRLLITVETAVSLTLRQFEKICFH